LDSALRWVGLALESAGHPGLRRRLLVTAEPDVSLLPQGWEARARSEIDRVRRLGLALVTPPEDGYPPLLRASSDPPPVLYVRGRLEAEDRLAVAIVGARRATPHGERFAARLAEDLALRGFTVVSGLARGIDAAAHRGALACGGRTIAVLGCGLDRVYPRDHARLAEAIAANGAVVSELPLGSAPLKRNFPERNRLIAWLSWATVVVEAARDSGSLITGRLAADEGRMVLAVPGSVGDPNADGTNGLLRQGAACCRGIEDVLDDLAPQIVETAAAVAAARTAGAPPTRDAADGPEGDARRTRPAVGLTADERLVLEALPAARGIGAEELGAACEMPPGRLLPALLSLELRGLLRPLPGRRYQKSG
jgi:DNA processing protein